MRNILADEVDKKIKEATLNLIGNLNGKFYEYESEGIKKCVYSNFDYFIVFWYLEQELYYDYFRTDFSGKINMICIGDYEIRYGEKIYFIDLNKGSSESLSLVSCDDITEEAVISYVQYYNGVLVSMSYKSKVKNGNINLYNLDKPFMISLTDQCEWCYQKANNVDDIYYLKADDFSCSILNRLPVKLYYNWFGIAKGLKEKGFNNTVSDIVKDYCDDGYLIKEEYQNVANKINGVYTLDEIMKKNLNSRRKVNE